MHLQHVSAHTLSVSDSTLLHIGVCGYTPTQGSTSEAVLVALLAARARAMRGQPPAQALNLVAYGSDQVCDGLHHPLQHGRNTVVFDMPYPLNVCSSCS